MQSHFSHQPLSFVGWSPILMASGAQRVKIITSRLLPPPSFCQRVTSFKPVIKLINQCKNQPLSLTDTYQ